MKKIIFMILSVLIVFSAYSVIFAEETSSEIPFEDVKVSDWFYPDVKRVWDLEIMEGKSPSIFSPQSVMTRAEFVTMLSRLADSELDGMAEEAAAKFTDVPADAWFAPYVGWGVSLGIVTGYNDGTFLPDNPVNRQELAVMVVRFMDYSGITHPVPAPTVDTFGDFKSVGSWARPQVEILRNAGVVGGDENGYFNPKKSANRAEVAAIAGRYHELADVYFTDFAPKEASFELVADSEYTVSIDDMMSMLDVAVFDVCSFDSVEFKDVDILIEMLNRLDSGVHSVDIEVEFTRRNVICIGKYVLAFTRVDTANTTDDVIATDPLELTDPEEVATDSSIKV